MINEGVYTGKAVNSDIRISGKGTEWIEVDFEVTDEDGKDHTVAWRGFLTDKTIDRTIESMRLCGWHGDDIADAMKDGLGIRSVDLVIQHEEYKGKITPRIAFVNSAGSTQLTDEKRRSIAERVKQKANLKKIDPPPSEDPNDELGF